MITIDRFSNRIPTDQCAIFGDRNDPTQANGRKGELRGRGARGSDDFRRSLARQSPETREDQDQGKRRDKPVWSSE